MRGNDAYRVPPFTTYDEWIRYLVWNMKNDSDNVVVIDGPEGSGKSTLAQKIAKTIEELNGKKYDPEVQTVFTFKEFQGVWDPELKRRVFVFDEAMNLFFSREAMHNSQKQMVKLFAQIRQCNHTLILCIPNFHWIDKYLRESRVQYRLYVYKKNGWERGYAGLQWRVWIPSAIDSWMEELNWEIRFDPFLETDATWRAYLSRKRSSFSEGFSAVPFPPEKPVPGRRVDSDQESEDSFLMPSD